MSKPRVSAQLIVYGGRQNDDLPGVLAELAQIGFDAAEIGSNFIDEDPQVVKKAFDDAGIVCSGVHAGFALVSDAEWQKRAIDFLPAIDTKYSICSGVAPGEGIAQYNDAARPFNEYGALCEEAGLVFCYHNHGWEFEEYDGVKGIHRLCELTDPAAVQLNVDVYWVTVGGENPADFIHRYGNRVGYYHFKDGPYTPLGSVAPKPYEFVELGRGTVDLKGALAAAMEHNPMWITYEQDRTELTAGEAAKISFEHLKSLGL